MKNRGDNEKEKKKATRIRYAVFVKEQTEPLHLRG